LEVRKKIDQWKKQTELGEGEAEGGIDEPGPLWDPTKRFLQLQRGEARVCLQELVNVANQPGKHEVLADTDFIQRTCYGVLQNQRKLELMNYVLMRLGIARNLPISGETIQDIAVFVSGCEQYPMRRRMQEMQFLAVATKSTNVKPLDIEQVAAKTLRVISNKNEQLAKTIDESVRNPALGPSAPTLMSGIK
jgi:hypothetical protein